MDEPHRLGWIPATSRKANTPKELKMASRCSQDELPVFATAVGTPSSLTSRATPMPAFTFARYASLYDQAGSDELIRKATAR